jgi:hypothetical protein
MFWPNSGGYISFSQGGAKIRDRIFVEKSPAAENARSDFTDVGGMLKELNFQHNYCALTNSFCVCT